VLACAVAATMAVVSAVKSSSVRKIRNVLTNAF